MNPPYRANNTGTYIRKDVFEAKHIKTFTLKNLKKMNELRLGNIWRAKKMPDTIKCYTEDSGVDGYVKVPVGIRSYIPEQFTNDYHDNKVVSHPPLSRQSYDYQSSAVQDLMMSSVWLLWASTGSGKTQMICDITVRAQRRTLIMVQNLTQMSQMVDDIFTILWVTPTQVSGANVSKRNRMTFDDRITVCSIDSRDKINAKEYGLIILDECDTYLWSDARREWVGSLSPEFLYWLTGTIKVNHVDDSVFKLYYGKITELKLLNHTPNYVQVLSDFNYHLDDIKEFHLLKEALYTAEKRNELIITTAIKALAGWRKGLIFTEHVDHAKTLVKELVAKWIKAYMLIGEVSKDERERIRTEARMYWWSCVIVGSVKIIGRWFDLPELSFAVLTTCEKFNSNIEQYVGRLSRHYEGKPQAVFIDIVDHMTGIFNNQARSRLQTYRRAYPEGKVSIQ